MREIMPPYTVTAMTLNMNVWVHSQLTSARLQSLAIASRTGRNMKYATIRVKMNRKDSTVARISLGSTLVSAVTMRPIGPFPLLMSLFSAISCSA